MIIFLPYHESAESVKNVLSSSKTNREKDNMNHSSNKKDEIDIKE